MIYSLADMTELAEQLRAEQMWNENTRRDLASLLDENLRLSQELTTARRELEEYKREALEARNRELSAFLFDLVKPSNQMVV